MSTEPQKKADDTIHTHDGDQSDRKECTTRASRIRPMSELSYSPVKTSTFLLPSAFARVHVIFLSIGNDLDVDSRSEI